MMGNHRLIFADYLRSISIFYIVGYLHLLNYTEIFPGYYNYFTYLLTLIALSLIVFVSGYLIGIKKWDINLKSIVTFYYKKFLRIYPPFLVSIFLFISLGIIDTVSGKNVALLMSQFFPPNPITLWFIPMILLFYSISPLLYICAKNYLHYSSLIFSLVAGLIYYSNISGLLDKRLILYLPLFTVGLFFGRNDPFMKSIPVWMLIFCYPISWIIGNLDYPEYELNNYLMSPFLVTIVLMIFMFSIKFLQEGSNFCIEESVKYFSYSSYFVYLFHRPIFTIMLKIWSPISQGKKFLYLVIICLPVIIFLSWITQKSYDSLCDKLPKFNETINV